MPVFSFEKIRDADISLGPEMKSTGECLGIAKTFDEALYKAFLGAGVRLPKHKNMIITVRDEDKEEIIDIARRFSQIGYTIYSTHGTWKALRSAGIPARQVNKIEKDSPNLMDLILGHRIDLVIDTPPQGIEHQHDGFIIRRAAIETGVNVITALDTAKALITSLEDNSIEKLSLVDISRVDRRGMRCNTVFARPHHIGSERQNHRKRESYMISANDVTLRLGKRALFEDVNIKFTEGNCYGVIGANGAGKSTFLKILSGDLETTNGSVSVTPGQRLSVLEQDHFKYDNQIVLDTVIQGNQRLYEIGKEKDALYAKEDFSDADGIRASELEAEFAEMNGWESGVRCRVTPERTWHFAGVPSYDDEGPQRQPEGKNSSCKGSVRKSGYPAP